MNVVPREVVTDAATGRLAYTAARALTPDSVDLGEQMFEAPWTVSTACALAGQGYRPPSPILYEFDWPLVRGRWQRLKHQTDTAAFLSIWPRAFVLNEMGTGKTYSVVAAAEYLMQKGYVRRVQVVCPRSTMTSVWYDTIVRSTPGRSAVVLSGAAERRRKLAAKPYDYYIVNHEGIEVISNVYTKQRKRVVNGIEFVQKTDAITGVDYPIKDIDLFVIDEVAMKYRNSQTYIWAIMAKILAERPRAWVWALTGAPMPNSPVDIWAQVKLVRPDAIDPYFSNFRSRVMSSPAENVWVPKADAVETAYSAIYPSIRFRKADCTDIPPLVYDDLQCDLSPEQKRAFKEMMDTLVTELAGGGTMSAVNEGVKQLKLLQILCGAGYTKDGDSVVIGAPDRIAVLREVVEAATKKVLVFVPFRNVLNYVAAELAKHYGVETMHGGVGDAERARIFREFETTDKARVLVADPQCMAHGIDLIAADVTVWYGYKASNDIYVQANERTPRIGQTSQCTVLHLVSTAFERKLYGRLKAKQKLQGLLLEMAAEDTLKELVQ